MKAAFQNCSKKWLFWKGLIYFIGLVYWFLKNFNKIRKKTYQKGHLTATLPKI